MKSKQNPIFGWLCLNNMTGATLNKIVQASSLLKVVKKKEMEKGDVVYVKTHNSVYTVCVYGEGEYEVSGGWFASHGVDRIRIGINGCTWGGSAIKTDIIAACGLMLEFGNRLKTSCIEKIFVIHHCRLQ
jgi:hypothetical protein